VQACLPYDAVSFARLRVLYALQCHGDLTMKQLAESLEVTARRITVLVEALEEDRLVTRRPNPSDGRSTIVTITPAGLKQQGLGWTRHQDEVAQAFGDLAPEDQERLLDISRQLTEAFRKRLAARSMTAAELCDAGSPTRGLRRIVSR
jgi:DNA-binding MarR family transcriptional regulator